MTDVPPPIFETERLRAGNWSLGMAEAAFQVYGDPEVMQYVGGGTPQPDLDAMRDRLARSIARNAKWPDHWGSWPMYLKSTGELVGASLLLPLPDVEGNYTKDFEIGWHLAKRFWKQGFATEFGEKLIDIGLNEIGHKEIFAVVKPENSPSIAVAKRIGMTHQGQTTKYYGGKCVELFRVAKSS